MYISNFFFLSDLFTRCIPFLLLYVHIQYGFIVAFFHANLSMVPVEEFCRGGCFIELSISDYTQNNNRTMYNIMAIVEFFSQNLYFNGVLMEEDDDPGF